MQRPLSWSSKQLLRRSAVNLGYRRCSSPLSRSRVSPIVQRVFRPSRRTYSTAKDAIPTPEIPAKPESSVFYIGPLAKTFRSLKVFSLSSLGLCLSVSPFLYLIDSNMAQSARIGLIVFAVGTSSLSTALIGWIGSPYVSEMRNIDGVAPGAVELVTRNTFLQERRTRVYNPAFLGDTKRPFAKWELKSLVEVDARDTEAGSADVPPRPAGEPELVAETLDSKGKVLGRLVARWEKSDAMSSDVVLGVARQQGRVVRHFNVHEELLK